VMAAERAGVRAPAAELAMTSSRSCPAGAEVLRRAAPGFSREAFRTATVPSAASPTT